MDRNPAHVLLSHLDLSRVKPDPIFKAEGPHRLRDGRCAADGPCRSVEGRQEAVAEGFHLPAAETYELPAHGSMVSVQETAPTLIPQLLRTSGRADDVRKKHCREHPVDIDRRL